MGDPGVNVGISMGIQGNDRILAKSALVDRNPYFVARGSAKYNGSSSSCFSGRIASEERSRKPYPGTA